MSMSSRSAPALGNVCINCRATVHMLASAPKQANIAHGNNWRSHRQKASSAQGPPHKQRAPNRPTTHKGPCSECHIIKTASQTLELFQGLPLR
eukprot:1147670-Pelagomonas_calceolata.AAC.6